MPNPNDYNMDYRPETYWGSLTVQQQLASTIKGHVRRAMVLKNIEDGEFVPDALLESSLSQDLRDMVGRYDPRDMGGEYLPDPKSNEVEIARIIEKTTTMDVTSIRARKTKHRIIYRIVDEYEYERESKNLGGSTRYYLPKKTSRYPLAFREMIDLIDHAWEDEGKRMSLVTSYKDWCMAFDPVGHNVEEIWDHATVESVFYPELARWYDEENAEWLKNHQDKQDL